MNWCRSHPVDMDERISYVRQQVRINPNPWLFHQCDVLGCKEQVLVIDGNEKIHRPVCKASRMITGDLPTDLALIHGMSYERLKQFWQTCFRDPVRGNRSGKDKDGKWIGGRNQSQYCDYHQHLQQQEDEKERQKKINEDSLTAALTLPSSSSFSSSSISSTTADVPAVMQMDLVDATQLLHMKLKESNESTEAVPTTPPPTKKQADGSAVRRSTRKTKCKF